jgi:cyanate permease
MESLPGQRVTGRALPRSPYRFVIAGLLLAAHLAVGLNAFVVAPLFPLIIDEYEIRRATASLLVALPLLVTAGFGLPGGVIIARLGVRKSTLAGWCLVALLALAAVVPNFATLLLSRLAFGAGVAFLLTASGPLLMRWFGPKELLVMNGLDTAALSLGIALSVTTAAPLAEALGWQNTLAVFGTAGVIGAVAWVVLGRTPDDGSHKAPMVSRKELWAVLSKRWVILLVAADAGVLTQYTALSSWLPTFYNEVRGISLARAGFVTGLLPFVGVFGVLAGGILATRTRSKSVFFTVPGVLVVVGGIGTFISGNMPAIYASVIILGIGSWLYVPTILSLPMEMPGMTPERVAIVWGTYLTASGFGMFLAPLLVGALRDTTGSFLPGFTACAAAAGSLLVAGILLPRSDTGPG